MMPQLGMMEPLTLTVGDESLRRRARLVELAYTRVDMVGRRGELLCGGILDIFAPTAEYPVRVEFHEITGDADVRADQRSIPEIDIHTAAFACRCRAKNARAAQLAARHPAPEHRHRQCFRHAGEVAEGIAVDGM